MTGTEVSWEDRRTSFGSAAAQYKAGRPGYPREVLLQCLPEWANQVLDLAAGTGPLTANLLDIGLSVIAVEPLDEMRALIPPEAQALAGTAEEIPLPDESVDAVFIGQAWHWFDVPRAVADIHRVLRPGGVVAPMWNLLDAADPVSLRLAEVASQDECSANMLGEDAEPPFDPAGLFSPPERLIVPFALPYNRERVAALISSVSVTINAPADERAAIIDAATSVVPERDFFLSWICEAWRAEKI
ncbi:MAG TPA: methyltransferase domain-containing protein [Mycobacteriales bacterium]|jgi:SAM-dependent methyltransferase|nr:methyltransferase domain-containing protein [Mycobacteriales bacterium]